MSTITITLIGKPGCHLCDDARKVIEEVSTEFPRSVLAIEEKSIEDDKNLFDQYWEKIPVVQINGKVHNYWRIEPERLRKALKELV